MKKRTGIIGVLIAILVLGIGYAAVSGVDLLVNGTANVKVDDANFKVHYDQSANPTITMGDGVVNTATVTATYTDDLHATINVDGFTKRGDKVTVVYTIVNESEDIDATLSSPEIGEFDTEYFNVTATLGKEELAKGGDTTTLTVVVEAIKTPTVDDVSTNINITVPADPVL